MVKANRNVLGIKLRRDMLRAAMQFLSIIALCALGTFAFSALDGTARMVRVTVNHYFEENNLADLFITLPRADRTALAGFRDIAGIRQLRTRAVFDMDADGLGEDTRLNVVLYDGAMDINIPLLREGTVLDTSDLRGCLMEERFAHVHDLHPGDRVTLRQDGQRTDFVIRGLVTSPEFIVVSSDVAADPETYGYILANSAAFPEVPLTQIILKADPGTDVTDLAGRISTRFPEALIVDHGAHKSTSRINNDAQMFENMTLIFPLLAYFIAALIVMTTLERMIDNQRLQLGTLVSLGFSHRAIRNHYLSYSIVPSLIGAVIGVLVGHFTLPVILWNALLGQSEMPYRLHPPISLPAWGMVLLTVVMSMGICLRAYRRTARETPAELLRPKPPKSGRRILMERIPLLWNHLSFNSKMIVRNLMRNKMRSFMFMLGILFCTMLIITSFGLQDSVKRLTSDYYLRAMRYNVTARLNSQPDKAESYERRIEADRVECVMSRSITLRTPNGSRTVLLNVLEDRQQLQNLGPDCTYTALPENGAAITRKLSRTLQVKPGDSVELWLPGEQSALIMPVLAVVENNFSQGIYMTRSVWEQQRKGPFIPTTIQAQHPTERGIQQLNDLEEVTQVDFPAEQIKETLAMLDTLSSVFNLLTGIALALAFVICYNMGLMNFVERIREYATLKVLGYHKREIRSLILRENIILTLFGILFGIVPGILLTDIIMHSCEPETAFYSGMPEPSSIVLASVITFAFSIFLQLLLTRKVQKIDMVEALKSVE